MRDTIDMVREAGPLMSTPFDLWCEKFAALVRADEREVCAKVADYMAGRCKHPDEIADAIRERKAND